MRFVKHNELYIPKKQGHYMGCMGIEDILPQRIIYPKLSKKSILNPGTSEGSAGQSTIPPTIYWTETFDNDQHCVNDAAYSSNCFSNHCYTVPGKGAGSTIDFDSTAISPKSGTYSCQCVAASGERAQVQRDLGTTYTKLYAGFYFYYATGGTTNRAIFKTMQLTTFTKVIGIAARNNTGTTVTLYVDGAGLTGKDLATTVTTGTWNHIELKYDSDGDAAGVKINGGAEETITYSAASEITDCRYFSFGPNDTTALALTTYFDYITIADGWVGPTQ